MLVDLIRKVVPINMRQDVGLWTATQVGRSKLLAYPYFFMLCGKIPRHLKLLPNNHCAVIYDGVRILAPRDAIFTFIEVLQSDVYEKYWMPKETDVVLDVGAYVGMFSVKICKKVKAVIAIEPSQSNFSYLKSNVFGLSNIMPVRVAASDKAGTAQLFLSNASACHTMIRDHKDFTWVATDTLDNITESLGYEYVDFIKIDAEGAELAILRGSARLLTGNPKLAIGAYHNMEDGKPEKPLLVNFLVGHGYGVKSEGGYLYAERKETGLF